MDLEIVEYKISSCNDMPVDIIDWNSLNIEKLAGITKSTDTVRKEYQFMRCETNNSGTGSGIIIQSYIYIPCSVIHKDIRLDGTFYQYINDTKFQTDKPNIPQLLIAEMALYHFGRVFWFICNDSKNMTYDSNPYFIETKSLGTLLLMVEGKYGISK